MVDPSNRQAPAGDRGQRSPARDAKPSTRRARHLYWRAPSARRPIRHERYRTSVVNRRCALPLLAGSRASAAMRGPSPLAAGAARRERQVTMRPVPHALVRPAVLVTARYPSGHGTPVEIGDPKALGMSNVQAPDSGTAPPIGQGNVSVFWACGARPEGVLSQLRSA